MSFLDALTVSASALTAERARMDVTAENLANAQTTRTDAGGPYRRKVVEQSMVRGNATPDHFWIIVPALNEEVVVGNTVAAALTNPAAAGKLFASVQDDSSIISRMASVLGHPFKVGFADSMSLVLLGGGIVMILAFGILTLLPAVSLRSTSGGAAARAEERAAQGAEAAATRPAGAHAAVVPTLVDAAPAAGRHAADGPAQED